MGNISAKNLAEAFIGSAKTYPDRLFLSNDINLSFTYSEALTKASAISNQLRNLGIGKNDNVAIICENTPLWPIAYFAVMLASATAVPILPEFSAEDIAKLISHSESKAIFASSRQILKIEGRKLPLFEINEGDIIPTKNQERAANCRTVEQINPSGILGVIPIVILEPSTFSVPTKVTG